MYKQINHGIDSILALKRGVDALADTVKVTLGPKGRPVIIETAYGDSILTKDGVTVAQNVSLKDPLENQGAKLVKNVTLKTNDLAGDGPQPLWAKVLTPDGFIAMGDIKKGDIICGTNGSVQQVEDVYDKGVKKLYKVTLTDGRSVECSSDHLWTVTTEWGMEKTLTTAEMSIKLFRDSENSRGHRYFIKNTTAFFNERDLMIDPYTLGVLLGDGSLSGTGSIELSLGLKKRHVIGKLILPEGTETNTKEYHNYIRIKLNGRSIKDALTSLGLYGSKSGTKFIPDEYLLSSYQQRKALLRGLLDTDGHINSRGLFEFSTISAVLAEDFTALCRSLGIPLNVSLHRRKDGEGSYSKTPIYRISELKGYKYGTPIHSIENLWKETDMRCIKVTNEDHLYITDDFVLTHNTTTSAVLAQAIISEGVKLVSGGTNGQTLKKGIDKASKAIVEALKGLSVEVTDDLLVNIASISANDPEIGKVVADALIQVGKNGTLTVEDGNTAGIKTEFVEGLRFDRGFISPYFAFNRADGCILNNPLIFVTDKGIADQDTAVTVVEKAMAEGKRDILIIAETVEGEALNTLVAGYLQGKINVCAVKAPGFANHKKELLLDIAAISGSKLISDESGKDINSLEFSDYGSADKVVITKDTATIIGGHGKKEDIATRISTLENEKESANSEFEKERLRERIAKLSGGIGVIKVGAATEIEAKEIKHRIEDAIRATQAAREEGILPGGGVALIRAAKNVKTEFTADEIIGAGILSRAIEAPLRTIADNAGQEGGYIVRKVQEYSGNVGYDAMNNRLVDDMVKEGIIDPTKVTRLALENAVSIAAGILSSGASMTTIQDEVK